MFTVSDERAQAGQGEEHTSQLLLGATCMQRPLGESGWGFKEFWSCA